MAKFSRSTSLDPRILKNTEKAGYSTSSTTRPNQTVSSVPSFSFSGCGFLGVYHVGVAACLKFNTDVTRRPEIKFAGASAGALVATTVLLDDVDFSKCRILLLCHIIV